ncbi:hypothetical protein WJX77_008053 [Trebouxia sp. C0004]
MQVFESWIKTVNSRMASQRRHILMLMDNASSHRIVTIPLEKLQGLDSFRLSNILVVYLPPNTTSKVQPLDAGIIAAFKQHYRKYLLRWYLSQYETAADNVNLAKLVPGILPPTMSAQIVSNDQRERHRDNAAALELSDLINSLNLGLDALTAEEYEQFPGEQEVERLTSLAEAG